MADKKEKETRDGEERADIKQDGRMAMLAVKTRLAWKIEYEKD